MSALHDQACTENLVENFTYSAASLPAAGLGMWVASSKEPVEPDGEQAPARHRTAVAAGPVGTTWSAWPRHGDTRPLVLQYS